MRQLHAGTHRIVNAAKDLFYPAYLRLVLQKDGCIEVGDLQASTAISQVLPALMQ